MKTSANNPQSAIPNLQSAILNPQSPFDVAIIGAGIVGAACAYECARAGLRVAVIERAVIGGGATAEGMGHITVMDDSEAQFALTRYSQQLWDELAQELPAAVEYERCGTIWVAADEKEMAEVYRKREFYGARGVATEVLDEKQLAEAEPQLRKGLAGGLLVPGDSVIYPPCAAAFLLAQAQAHGAELICGEVTRLGEGEVGLRGEKGFWTIAAKVSVNAAGSWSPELTRGIDVQPRKGHLVITDRYPGFVRHQLVELGYLKSAHTHNAASVAFNAQPRKTGQILLGSSRQFGVESREVDPPMLSWMLRRASEYLPAFAQLSAVRVWTGFRAATADHLPLIGPCPERAGHYLATGHEGLGITTSLGTARLLADQLLNRKSAIPCEPYLPSRKTQEAAHA
jgi:glycine/D-amino acid oxidase-like deaminating enzyme